MSRRRREQLILYISRFWVLISNRASDGCIENFDSTSSVIGTRSIDRDFEAIRFRTVFSRAEFRKFCARHSDADATPRRIGVTFIHSSLERVGEAVNDRSDSEILRNDFSLDSRFRLLRYRRMLSELDCSVDRCMRISIFCSSFSSPSGLTLIAKNFSMLLLDLLIITAYHNFPLRT